VRHAHRFQNSDTADRLLEWRIEEKNANREIELRLAIECLQSAKVRMNLHHVMVAGHPRVSPQTPACAFVASELAWLASAPRPRNTSF
jgi:hypothetical protein